MLSEEGGEYSDFCDENIYSLCDGPCAACDAEEDHQSAILHKGAKTVKT